MFGRTTRSDRSNSNELEKYTFKVGTYKLIYEIIKKVTNEVSFFSEKSNVSRDIPMDWSLLNDVITRLVGLHNLKIKLKGFQSGKNALKLTGEMCLPKY